MVEVIDIDLKRLGLSLPRGEVAIVLAQPYVSLEPVEPFNWVSTERQRALECIDEALAVSRSCAHGAEKTHFTIFPECTIPGLCGVDRITAAMQSEDWPNETIIIGGVDGLTKDQLVELVQRPNTNYDCIRNSFERLQAHQWVNCVVTWAKLESGEVHSWVQPKLSPAWVERDVNYMSMYRGSSIFVFRGTYSNADVPFRFSTLLCFDWIGTAEDARRMWLFLLKGIHSQAGDGVLPLTWLFIAQCNPAPSHASFMNQVVSFFECPEYPRVTRDETCLIMSNVAGKSMPGKTQTYGQSAVIFTPNRFSLPNCMPTYSNGGVTQRGTGTLENFRDAVFRERGACIHSFLVAHPSTLPMGAAGRQVAVREASVHPYGDLRDPRAPSGAVPAVVKWINDELDEPEKSLANKYKFAPLEALADIAHQKTVDVLRTLKAESLKNTVNFACPTASKRTPDDWQDEESLALTHLLHTLSIFDVAKYSIKIHGNGAQATITSDDISLELIAVMGASHEQCDKHVLSCHPMHKGRLVVVSRDEDNNSWDPRLMSILDQDSDEIPAEAKFTQPSSAIIRIGYCDVLNAFKNASNEVELKGKLNAKIS